MRANQLKTRSRFAQDKTSRLAKDAVKTHRKRVASASQARLKRVFSVCGPLYALSGDCRGAYVARLAVRARVAVCRTIIIMVCADYVARSKSNSKEAHLACSQLIKF